MAHPFFTIGHSTRSTEAFIELLRQSEIQLVIDVRKVPHSRANPQYERDALAASLAAHQIAYEHVPELGGLRGRRRDVAQTVNAAWQNQSFHNFADYALSESFRSGLAKLRQLGHARRCAIMCAEALWWQCHRRIIADYLLAAGETVFHILGRNKVEEARTTAGAKAGPAETLTYPAGA
jgi:uncharacterized protein (DUF488 family)